MSSSFIPFCTALAKLVMLFCCVFHGQLPAFALRISKWLVLAGNAFDNLNSLVILWMFLPFGPHDAFLSVYMHFNFILK